VFRAEGIDPHLVSGAEAVRRDGIIGALLLRDMKAGGGANDWAGRRNCAAAVPQAFSGSGHRSLSVST
jgi:hypothetical protein